METDVKTIREAVKFASNLMGREYNIGPESQKMLKRCPKPPPLPYACKS